MANLADIAREAGRGGGLAALSKQYGLDAKQTAKVVEALLPAFTLAFQRLVLNPSAFADFTKTLTSGAYAPFFDNPVQSQAALHGAGLVEQLFRSPEASRQVAAQAAALTGVGVQVMQEIMPTLAATVVGGMFRYATVEGFAGLLRQWGDALKAASEQLDPPKPQDPWAAWQAAAGEMMGLRPAAPPTPKPPELANVLDAWVALVGAMAGMGGASPPVAPPPPRAASSAPSPQRLESPAPAGSAAEDVPEVDDEGAAAAEPDDRPPGQVASEEPNPFEAMSQMFETGREVHAQHVAAFQSILDNVWGPARKG